MHVIMLWLLKRPHVNSYVIFIACIVVYGCNGAWVLALKIAQTHREYSKISLIRAEWDQRGAVTQICPYLRINYFTNINNIIKCYVHVSKGGHANKSQWASFFSLSFQISPTVHFGTPSSSETILCDLPFQTSEMSFNTKVETLLASSPGSSQLFVVACEKLGGAWGRG